MLTISWSTDAVIVTKDIRPCSNNSYYLCVYILYFDIYCISICTQNLQRLDLSYISYLGPDLLCRLVSKLPRVKYINFQMTPVTDQVRKQPNYEWRNYWNQSRLFDFFFLAKGFGSNWHLVPTTAQFRRLFDSRFGSRTRIAGRSGTGRPSSPADATRFNWHSCYSFSKCPTHIPVYFYFCFYLFNSLHDWDHRVSLRSCAPCRSCARWNTNTCFKFSIILPSSKEMKEHWPALTVIVWQVSNPATKSTPTRTSWRPSTCVRNCNRLPWQPDRLYEKLLFGIWPDWPGYATCRWPTDRRHIRSIFIPASSPSCKLSAINSTISFWPDSPASMF